MRSSSPSQVGEEAKLGNVEDPWASAGKPTKASNGSKETAELPEPLPIILLDETLPITPRELWKLVMGTPDFLKSVSESRKNRDLKIGRWRLSKGIWQQARSSHLYQTDLTTCASAHPRLPFLLNSLHDAGSHAVYTQSICAAACTWGFMSLKHSGSTAYIGVASASSQQIKQ